MSNREVIEALKEQNPDERCRVRVRAQHDEIDLDVLEIRRINDTAIKGHPSPYTVIEAEDVLIKAEFALEK